MSRPSYRGLFLLSSAALGLGTAVLVMDSIGCGDVPRNLTQGSKGECKDDTDHNRCRDTTTIDGCVGPDKLYPLKAPGSTCDFGGAGSKDGLCQEGACVSKCSVPPNKCPCDADADCPASSPCVMRQCSDKLCKSMNLPDGPLVGGVTDSCQQSVCQGGQLDLRPVSAGTACKHAVGPGVCDDAGHCGPCSAVGPDKGCGPKEYCYKQGTDALACTQCNNGQQDPGELGKDCGGICAQYNVGSPTCGLGTTCSSPTQCTSGFCPQDVCCNEACEGLCKSCSEGPSGPGLCGAVPTGAPEPQMRCPAGAFCAPTAMGVGCLSIAGAACTKPDGCMSANCVMNKCTPGAKGKPCVTAADCVTNTCNSDHVCG